MRDYKKYCKELEEKILMLEKENRDLKELEKEYGIYNSQLSRIQEILDEY